ncbi:RagB/SusD family nutrient uptake outer membrane protein [Flavobacterium sp. NST-5]|uniref:RagB/SusD family nutrient uptake outer membrane protein n=1 Tax=Flavobacterium ichthyis TaxID=2698827 RepID=A0ABW9Z8D1_9FLAO|nr:RagB/SusD family nutrient uptake outer membrane protein [Flavobacterium ichthyis]NBL64099.1 RagB/SusD family nutrient uptake outer membrane protein [Flavobacterium ichthyis]
MKKNIFIALIAISSFSTITISCSDEFVERKPAYSLGADNYFNNEEEYNMALIAAYDILQSTYVNVLLGEIASDNTLAGGESANDVVGFQQVDEMIHNQINPNIKNVWDWMFAGVNRASYVLQNKDKADFPNKAHVIAEARFLKAYFMFELVKWFGPIPVKEDAIFVLGDEKTLPRESVENVYAAIQNELIMAIPDLNTIPAQKGRVTKGAAQALLGKAYLYDNKFNEATQILEELISVTGGYSLVSNYDTLFEVAEENGVESVFEVQYTDIQGAGFECLQCSEGNVAVGFNGPRNYSGPRFSSGYSFNVPTQEVYNAFEAGDLRRDAAILNIEAWAATTGASYGIGYKHTGYFNKKYIPRTRSSEAAGDLNLTNPNNYRAIRYADVLLMAAEAYNKIGNDTKAREYLNLVRRRAFGDTNHDINASGPALGEFIQEERRLEFVGEGHRFFDLVRTGTAAGTIPGFTANKNEVFPVPIEEIQFSAGNWQQNQGY